MQCRCGYYRHIFILYLYDVYPAEAPRTAPETIVFYSNVFASNVECLYGLKFKADNGFSGIGDSRKVFQSHGTLTVYDSLNHPIVSLHVFCTIDMEKKIGSIMDDRSSMLPDITDKKVQDFMYWLRKGQINLDKFQFDSAKFISSGEWRLSANDGYAGSFKIL